MRPTDWSDLQAAVEVSHDIPGEFIEIKPSRLSALLSALISLYKENQTLKEGQRMAAHMQVNQSIAGVSTHDNWHTWEVGIGPFSIAPDGDVQFQTSGLGWGTIEDGHIRLDGWNLLVRTSLESGRIVRRAVAWDAQESWFGLAIQRVNSDLPLGEHCHQLSRVGYLATNEFVPERVGKDFKIAAKPLEDSWGQPV